MAKKSLGSQLKLADIAKCVNPQFWGTTDFRSLRRELFHAAKKKLENFVPLKDPGSGPIQVLDFFSGAGGTSQGLAAINKLFPLFKFLGGCDINFSSASSYSHNYATPIFNADIRDLAYKPGAMRKALKDMGFDRKKPTFLIGCAPCQGFSSHRKKHWGQEEDQRNNLIMAFMEVVRYVRPVVVLMENVPEFLSGRYWEHFAAARKSLMKMGYIVKDNIYNAATFGVPQERFRSIVICMRKDFLLPTPIYSKGRFRTVRDAIGDLTPVVAGEQNPVDGLHRCARHSASTLAVIRAVPHDGGNRPAGIGPKCLDKTKGFSDVYGRLYWDRPSITITHYARNPASGRYTHPEQDRVITAREAALLQSFPKGFMFMGKADDVYRQIGEAVPPLLSLGVISGILLEMISTSPTQAQLDASPKPIAKPVSNSYSSVIAGIKLARKGTK